MRISLSTLKLNNNTYCSNTNTVANQPCCEKEARNNGVSVPLHSLQANCALSFGAAAIHDNTKTFYDAYEPVLPKKFRDALKDYNDNLHLNPLNQKSLFDINYDTYKKLADCHTVDDIKAAYPDEPLFQELRPAYEVELPKQKCHLKTFLVTYCDYFAASDRANGQPVFSASNDDDLTVYLVKKAFLEGKSQTEIQKDFANDLNQSLAEKLPAFEDIPRTLYDKLGILYFKPVDFGAYSALSKEDKEKLNMHSVRYRSSFVSSRQDFNRKHTNVYVKAKKDKIIEKLIDKILTDTPGRTFVRSEKESLIDDIFGTKETGMNPAKTGINGKSQYILYLAWNNSPELRKDWAEFLNRKEAEGCVSVEDYNPNLVNMSAALKNRMTEFFGETPSRKVDLTATCSDAYDIVSNAVENDVYEELKGAILEERNKIIEDFKTKKAEADKLAEAARLAAEKERLERLEQEKAEKAKADILAQEKLKAEEIAKLERAAKEEAAAAKEAEINAEIAIMRPSFIIAPEKAMREIAETRLAFRMLEAEKTRIKEAVRALPGVIFIGDVAMIEYNEAYGESYVALTSMQKGVEVINQKIENLVMKQQKNH